MKHWGKLPDPNYSVTEQYALGACKISFLEDVQGKDSICWDNQIASCSLESLLQKAQNSSCWHAALLKNQSRASFVPGSL